jgi:hypothetical protein
MSDKKSCASVPLSRSFSDMKFDYAGALSILEISMNIPCEHHICKTIDKSANSIMHALQEIRHSLSAGI